MNKIFCLHPFNDNNNTMIQFNSSSDDSDYPRENGKFRNMAVIIRQIISAIDIESAISVIINQDSRSW